MTKLKVTENHMKRGRKDNQRSCPIALCIRGHFHQHFGGDVLVSNKGIYSSIPLTDWAERENANTYTLSNGIQDWIHRYDTGFPVPEITIGVKRDHLYIMEE